MRQWTHEKHDTGRSASHAQPVSAHEQALRLSRMRCAPAGRMKTAGVEEEY